MKLSTNEAALIFAVVGQQVPGYDDIRIYPEKAEDAFRALYGKPYHHKMMRVNGDSLCCSGVRSNIVSATFKHTISEQTELQLTV